MKKRVLVILLLIVGLFIFTGCDSKDSSKTIKETLESKGYVFDNILYIDGISEFYITSEDGKMTIIKYNNSSTGEKKYYYNNSDVNDASADITSKDLNTSDDEIKQYESYIDWLAKNELSKDQIKDVLDYYNNSINN